MADKAITRRLNIYVNGQEVERTLTNIRKEYNKAKAQMNRAPIGSKEWQEAAKTVDQLGDEFKKARKEQEDFINSTKDGDQALNEFSSSISGIFEGLKKGKLPSFSELTTGLRSATKAALAFIATPIGAAIAALAGIAAVAKEWLNYNEEARKANIITEQITKLSDDSLDRARVRAQSLEKTFGSDFKDNLETARALVNEFGITYDEAFDRIEDGLIKGGAANDDFLHSLREYPLFFAKAGFSVKEFQNIVNTGIDLGIYDDKLPDALKEFSLSVNEQTASSRAALENAFGKEFTDKLFAGIRDGSITVKDALLQISEEAENAGLSVQQQQQLTADLFRGAGEDAGGALKIFQAVTTAFENQDKALTPLQQSMKDVADSQRDLALAQDLALKSDGYEIWKNKAMEALNAVKQGFYETLAAITNSREELDKMIKDQAKQDNIAFNVEEGKKQFDAYIESIKSKLGEKFKYEEMGERYIANLKQSLAAEQASGNTDQAAALKAEIDAVQKQYDAQIAITKQGEAEKTKAITAETQKRQDEAKKSGEKEAKEREKQQEALVAKVKELEQEALLAKQDLDEQEIQKIKDKYAKLLAVAKQGSKEEGQLLALQDQEINAKRLEQAEAFEQAKEEVRKKYNLLTNEEKQTQELDALKSLYEKQLVSEEEYQIAKKGIEDAYKLQKEEEAQEAREAEAERIEEELASILENDELTDRERYDAQLSRLQEFLNAKQISEEEYEKRVDKIKTKYLQSQLQKSQVIFGALGNLVASAKEAELNNIAEVTQKRGESEEDFVKRKEEAEKKKKEINKKYAGIELLVTIGKTVASTALGIIRAYSDLGPIAGSIFAGIVGTVGAIQIAQAKKQYDNVKSYSTGGDTGYGDIGMGRNSGGHIRGVVEEGEYVIPRFVRNDPEVPRIIDYLENKRNQKMGSYANVGEVGASNQQAPSNNLAGIMERLIEKLDEPLKITYTLNDEIDRRNLAKKLDDTVNESKGK